MFAVSIIIALLLMLSPVIASICGYRGKTDAYDTSKQLEREMLTYVTRENRSNHQ